MNVKIKLFAALQDRLPPGSEGHNGSLELEDGATAQTVIDRLQIPPAMAALVMVDGMHLTREQVGKRQLRAGETVTIVPPFAGG